MRRVSLVHVGKRNSPRFVGVSHLCVVRSLTAERLVRAVYHWVHVSHCERNSSRFVRVSHFCVVGSVITESSVRAMNH